MSEMREVAAKFFDACETGQGWAACQAYCHSDATFSAQHVGSLTGIDTLEGYTEWMKGMLGPLPDAAYELKSFAVDEDRATVAACAAVTATHTGDGGPVPPTGKCVSADYAYVMAFDGGRIRHATKIWNDAHSLAQLGWA